MKEPLLETRCTTSKLLKQSDPPGYCKTTSHDLLRVNVGEMQDRDSWTTTLTVKMVIPKVALREADCRDSMADMFRKHVRDAIESDWAKFPFTVVEDVLGSVNVEGETGARARQ